MKKESCILLTLIMVISILSLSVFSVHQTRAQSLPAGIVFSVPITLTNNQSVATPAPFQQMIVVDSTAYSSHEATNLQNIAFFDSSGTVIPSWLESGNTSSSTNTIYWLKLADGIPASSSVTVYMGFASPTTNLFNALTTGEAPQLSSVYGEYDIGANVFAVYANFGGSTMPADWSLQGSASFIPNTGVETVNGSTSEEGAVVYGGNMTSPDIVIEASTFYSGGANDQNIGFYASGTPSGTGGWYDGGGLISNGYSATFDRWFNTSFLFYNRSELTTSNTLPSTSGYSFQQIVVTPASVQWNFASNTSRYYAGVYSQLSTAYTYEGVISNSNGGLFFSSSTGAATSTQYIFWLRIRALPANGVMPAVTFSDFSISSSPASGLVVQGGSTTATVSLTSLGGFSSAVSLSASSLPSGATASFSPSFETPSSTSTLTISASSLTPAGNYTLTITGTSGAISHSCAFALTVVAAPNFSINVSPTSESVDQGGSTTSTVSLSPINDFSSVVSLSASGLPTGANAAFSQTSGTPSFTSTFTISTSSSTTGGTYTISITGTGGGMTNTCTYTLTVMDFTISASPTSGSLDPGLAVTDNITVSPVSGFSGTVSLSASGLPKGANAAFSQTSGTPSFTSMLTISTSSATPGGTHTITITGTGGGVTHTYTYTLTVTGAPPSSGISTGVIIGIAIVIGCVVIAATIALVVRR